MASFGEVDELYKELYKKLETALTDYPPEMRELDVDKSIFEKNDIPEEIEDFIISMASNGFDPGKYGLRSFQRKWIIKLGEKLIDNGVEGNQAFRKATYIGTICIPDTDWDYGVTIKEQEYEKLNKRAAAADGKVLEDTTKHPMFNPNPDLSIEEKIISKGTIIPITKKDLQSFSDLKEDIYRDARETIQLIEEANSFCHKIITILDEIKEINNDRLHLKKVSYEILSKVMNGSGKEVSVPKTSQLRYAFYLKNVAEEVKKNINEKGQISSRLSNSVIKELGDTGIMAAEQLGALLQPPADLRAAPDTATGTGSSSVSKKKTKKRKRAKKRRSRRKL